MKAISASYEHFVYFTYKCEWKVFKDSEPKGYLKLFLPKSFPLNLKPITIPINKKSGFYETTIDACVDDFFIDCALRNSFLHILRYSNQDHKSKANNIKQVEENSKIINKKKNKKVFDKFTTESIFLDAGVLFIPDRKEAEITVQMQCFEYLTFSIQIDEELLSIPHIKKFSPAIVYISKIENHAFSNKSENNQPNNNFGMSESPIYLECQIGDSAYFLCPKYDRNQRIFNIDTAILISPRNDQSIVFKFHDRDDIVPDTFIGSGLYIPFIDDEYEEEEEDSDEDKDSILRSISEENLHQIATLKNGHILLNKSSNNNNNDNEKNGEIGKKKHHSHRKKHFKINSSSEYLKKAININENKPVIQYTSPLKTYYPSQQNSPSPLKSQFDTENNSINRRMIPNIPTTPPQHQKVSKNVTPNNDLISPPTIQKNTIPANFFSGRNSPSRILQPTSVSPIKPRVIDDSPPYGFCQFYLLPERHLNLNINSSNNDNSYQNFTVSIDIIDPSSRFSTTVAKEIEPIKRPFMVNKRPPQVSSAMQQNNADPFKTKCDLVDKNCFVEDPKIISIEKPTTKILRWILSCPRFSPVSRKLIEFVNDYHQTTIHGFSHVKNPCFQNCYRKSSDLITGFHFVSPKEEIFVLETRAFRPNKASLSLELFLRDLPKDTHIIGNNSYNFSAPRLYCCLESLIKRVEIPIVLEEFLQIKGLYFQNGENHKLFPISQKLISLISKSSFSEIIDSFPNYCDVKLLEKKAASLFSMPLQKNIPVVPIVYATGSDFGDAKIILNYTNKINNNFNDTNHNNNEEVVLIYKSENINNNSNDRNIKDPQKNKQKERLTNFYLAKPNSHNQRNASVSSKKKPDFSYQNPTNITNEDENNNIGKMIKPPNSLHDNTDIPRKSPRKKIQK